MHILEAAATSSEWMCRQMEARHGMLLLWTMLGSCPTGVASALSFSMLLLQQQLSGL